MIATAKRVQLVTVRLLNCRSLGEEMNPWNG